MQQFCTINYIYFFYLLHYEFHNYNLNFIEYSKKINVRIIFMRIIKIMNDEYVYFKFSIDIFSF